MKYTEIAVSTTEAASEVVADVLTELTGEGVAVYDKNDFLSADWDYCDDGILKNLRDEVIVKGFAKSDVASIVLKELQTKLEVVKQNLQAGKLAIALKDVDDNEWIEYRKKFFRPITVDNLVICPYDGNFDIQDEKTVVKLDVGIAFGTGEHETTQMCLELGQTLDVCGKEIADLGCGSGILGISFLRLGAKDCFFVDYDEQACAATERNLALNGITAATVKCGTLDKFDGKYEIIFANLTAEIIEKFIDDILHFAKPSAYVVFSGILLEREADILALCNEKHLTVKKIIRRGEWTAMMAQVQNG